ncbi:MAG: YicC family protein [Bradymonadales bacterium]|nr:MAG: YicC family protein [Bradymonadales bacterium]
MLLSMTGFCTASTEIQLPSSELSLRIELKAFNSRYLDLHWKIPKAYQAWESRLAELLKKHVSRGRIEISIQRQILQGGLSPLRLNLERARAYATSLRGIQEELGLSAELSLQNLLSFSDWLEVQEERSPCDVEWKALSEAFDNAGTSLRDSRQLEGSSLLKVLQSHHQELCRFVEIFQAAKDQLVRELRDRWRLRWQELSKDQKLDSTRMEQELVYFVGRSDFTEEVDRLLHLVQSFGKLLEAPAEKGRRLEFTAQEMLREANTLGSKCSSGLLLQEVIEMKSVIEKIREQVLNVE